MAMLEVLGNGTRTFFDLTGVRVRIGRSSTNDLVLGDSAVSREHAVLECFGSRWLIRDLDSANGTDLNGARLIAGNQRALKNNDEIALGRTRLVFRNPDSIDDQSTSKRTPPPKVMGRERKALVELCRPFLDGRGAFPAPATVKEIAERMFVSEAAVKAHLGRLYPKFEIYPEVPDKRRRLANKAIETGAVTRRDLKEDDDSDS